MLVRSGRADLVLADWQHTAGRLADTRARMAAVLDGLGLTILVTSIAGRRHAMRMSVPGSVPPARLCWPPPPTP
ncbi:MAG TPA: hypothetical protein VGP04_19945, partial [Pseudonocardiaceae bacterium]|nr:hypothetical protein [Pseudonocardiaceae bacterium]